MPSALTIVGAGPAGLAPLFAAATDGTFRDLLAKGVTILERSDEIGSGSLQDITITSDSPAEAFLDILVRSQEPQLRALSEHPYARQIEASRGEAVPLSYASSLLRIAAEVLLQIVADHPGCEVLRGTEVSRVCRNGPYAWEVESVDRLGVKRLHRSSSVHLATGAHQPVSRLETERVAGHPLLPLYADKLMQTGELFTLNGAARLRTKLTGKSDPKVVIVGGSTSAGAAAAYLLRRGQIPFSTRGVTLMHRSPLRLFYASAEEAHADGYTDFSSDDICPITGRVFRLSGFRFEPKNLFRNAFSLGGDVPDERLRLFPMAGRDKEAHELLAEADLIIAALGYIPRMCTVVDEDDEIIPLKTPTRGDWAMVDQTCTVLTESGSRLEGLTAMGLAIGPAASRELGGEANFRGQVNSLWLWQNRLGSRVVLSALERSRTPQLPLLRPAPPRLSEHIQELEQLEKSNTFTNFGPINTRFEQDILDRHFGGVGAVTTMCNATLALLLAIRNAIGETPGRRRFALMPSFTFAAAAQAAVWCGLTPLFCDIDPSTWLPCAESENALLELFGDDIAVIVPNATFGNSLDLDRYEALQQATGIPVVVDAAASIGCLNSDGLQFGTRSHLPIIFSMHATKSFSIGEGGIIYSADTELVTRLRTMSSFGFDASRTVRMPGLNAKLSEVAALTASLQLEAFPEQIAERERIAGWYAAALDPQITRQRPTGQRQLHSFQSMLLPHSAASMREEIRIALADRGVQTGCYFSPHLAQQPFMSVRSESPKLPVSDDISARILSLPHFLGMTQEEVFRIAQTVSDSIKACSLHPVTAPAPPAQNSSIARKRVS